MLSSVDGCEVYELAVSDGSDVNAGALVRGHDANMELHGCASHPTRNEFVTAGHLDFYYTAGMIVFLWKFYFFGVMLIIQCKTIVIR